MPLELDPEDYALLSGALSVYDGTFANPRMPASKEVRAAYAASPKGEASRVRYKQGQAYRESKYRENHTERQKAHRRKYARSEKGRASNREAVKRYYWKKKREREAASERNREGAGQAADGCDSPDRDD